MLVVEAKLKNGTPEQYQRLDEAIKTSQFVRNSCVRHWMDNKGTTRNDLQKLCSVLANNKETPWVNKLNSQARQSAADRAWFTDGFKAGEFDLWCSQKTLVYGSSGLGMVRCGGINRLNPYLARDLID